MILYQEAINKISSVAEKLPVENLACGKAVGRILATDILSTEMLPAFTNSAMDGFAYRHADVSTLTAPLRLNVIGTIAAGTRLIQTQATHSLQAWEIMTGAPVPSDCDSVIKVEDTQREANWVQLLKPTKLGENLRHAGQDIKIGDRIAKAGSQIFPEHLMLFAALGIETIPVIQKPKLSILSTGSELAADPQKNFGNIRNSTAPFLTAELTQLGVEPCFLGTTADEPGQFLDLIRAQLDQGVDIILSTGAVSMGKYDFVPTALRDLGADLIFHKVAIRPGKPLLFAKMGKTVFFGLPGNPVSTAVGLRFFIEPYLRSLRGLPPEQGIKSCLENTIDKPEGLACFFKATTTTRANKIVTTIHKGQESFKIAPLLYSNSWAVFPELGSEFAEEYEVEVFPLHSWAHKEFGI